MSADWKQRPEGGGRFAIWMIRGVTQHLGRPLARLLLLPITLYFLVVRGPERIASRAYLTRALGRPASLWDVARHIHCFAATLVDRVLLLRGRVQQFDVRIHGVQAVHEYLDAGRGVLLFGSHLGSFEVLRVLARRRPAYVIRVVLDKGHNPAMTQLLDALNPEIAAGVIVAAQDGPSLVLAIQQAVENGALVALLVDRTQADGAWQPASFLGGIARSRRRVDRHGVRAVLWRSACIAGQTATTVFDPFREGRAFRGRQRAGARVASPLRRQAGTSCRQAPYKVQLLRFRTAHYDASHARLSPRDDTRHTRDCRADAGADGVQPGAGLRRA